MISFLFFFLNSLIRLVWVAIHLTQFYTRPQALLPQKAIECYTDPNIISQHLHVYFFLGWFKLSATVSVDKKLSQTRN